MVKHVTACFPRDEIGGWSEIEGGWVSCWGELAWIHRVVDMVFPVQGRGENLGWVACRRKHDVSAFGGQPHGELRGRPITDLTSDDPAVYTEPVACCLIQLTPRHTNTRLNTRVALYAYADAYCTCGAVVGRTEHDRWMPRQIGEPRCPREGGSNPGSPTIGFVGTGSRKGRIAPKLSKFQVQTQLNARFYVDLILTSRYYHGCGMKYRKKKELNSRWKEKNVEKYRGCSVFEQAIAVQHRIAVANYRPV